jgi:ATP-binding cassette subfamily C protein
MTSAIPALALFAAAAMRIAPSLNRLFGALSSIRFYAPAVASVCRDLQESERGGYTRRPAAPPVASPGPGVRDLELKDITFSFDGAATPAISSVSISIPKGASVGIVGPSGAGKTTLVDLILGLLLPEAGRILVDGRDIHHDLATWQRTIGYVPQFIYLLDDTVRRNVALGIPDDRIDESRVRQALELAQLEELVRTLPRGIETEIGEHGARLSGGERQRVGIARALYLQPDVLMFDEATSALDTVTEAGIISTISRLSGSRTVIQVAHRLSTVDKCDVIYFLKNGRVVDRGRYSELMARNSEFRQLAGAEDGPSGNMSTHYGVLPPAAPDPV